MSMWMKFLCAVGILWVGGWDACKKESKPPDVRLRDPWQAQMDATQLMGEQAVCSGQTASTPLWSGESTIVIATGGYSCWSACGDRRTAICPADARQKCLMVLRPTSTTQITPEKP